MTKEKKFSEINNLLNGKKFSIVHTDSERPWGGFFVIDEKDSEKFIQHFFPELDKKNLMSGAKLSPKILLVEPEKKLSWQYHYRRAEIWKLINGVGALIKSDTDIQGETIVLKLGDIITLKQGERHRLVGLHDWGVIAEIWMHTDVTNPSDEEDIVRVQDDFGR